MDLFLPADTSYWLFQPSSSPLFGRKNAKLDKYIFSTPEAASKTAPLQQLAPFSVRNPGKDKKVIAGVISEGVSKLLQCSSTTLILPHEASSQEGKVRDLIKMSEQEQ